MPLIPLSALCDEAAMGCGTRGERCDGRRQEARVLAEFDKLPDLPGHTRRLTCACWDLDPACPDHTSLLPEADLAIAEAAARLVPRARATSEDTGRGADVQPGEADEPVPNDADPSGNIREINSPSARAPLTQTAPDEESEAE
ncbi:hypothetical protein ACFRFL_13785 [Streptomyces sp. NPDC056708]|uniref:hypothetical protein n=1 Tax=unclassified Streptomyces TaxID=2593676 RepID=UPI00368205E0